MIDMGLATLRLTAEDEDAEFTVSDEQIAAARDPNRSFGGLVERPEPKLPRHLGRPYLVWRYDLALARLVNDRLAGATAD
jgi:hypothetical protein